MRRDNISIRYRQVSILRRWSITIFSKLELLQDEHSFIIWCRLIENFWKSKTNRLHNYYTPGIIKQKNNEKQKQKTKEKTLQKKREKCLQFPYSLQQHFSLGNTFSISKKSLQKKNENVCYYRMYLLILLFIV